MNYVFPLDIARQNLAFAMRAENEAGYVEPLAISPWMAMSLLQKAVRRGEKQFALQAASTLLLSAPDRLWRRLGGIAFEDVGLADLEVVSHATAALGGKRVRAELGGEWAVARFLVQRLVAAPKCRAADDLLMTAEAHPSFEDDRLQLDFLPARELFEIATGDHPIVRRALAAWYCTGVHARMTQRLRPRAGCPQSFFDHLSEASVPFTLVEVSREGFRRGLGMLCPLVAMLYPERQAAPTTLVNDELPPETMVGVMPSWSLDMYSYEGKAALGRFLQTQTETARWVRDQIAPASRVKFLGGIVFRVEGGLMRQRQCWPLGDELRSFMEIEANDHCSDASEVLALARAEIPVLNEVRNVR